MACDITLGRAEQCKDSVGGLKAVYFINWGDATTVTYSATSGQEDVITALGGAAVGYKYELKGSSTFEQSVTSSRENGTTFVDQKLSLSLKKLSVADHKQLKLLAYGRPQVIIEDNNGNFFMAGLTKGMDLTTATISSGANMADMSGYKMEFQGMEPVPANFIKPTAGTLVTAVLASIVEGA
ncbi:hypothetical protein UFOVP531_5 [uncultured Caudovirales phage]|uniref:Uncharacterized protein n=1 Tax=uncultured Caudovirales phage TaxID=2100421 RepID=A0A6J5MMY9_9CAUD|nr:hypothetical protein UFOVP531_5 [uncultured Caudovirales phage]